MIGPGSAWRSSAALHFACFFTSENGPQRDSWPDTGYTPFCRAKAPCWEGGIRAPGIAYWKGTIAAGRESDELSNLYIDSKEKSPVGHRQNAFLAAMAAELKAHGATFRKFPPKDIGLGQ